jgi:hypothetical protein
VKRVFGPLAVLAATLAVGAPAAQERPLLGLQWGANLGPQSLLEVDPFTLAPAGRSLELGHKGVASWSGSPDGRLLALGPWDDPRVMIVDRVSLRVVREIALRPGYYAQALVWVAPGRLLALVGSCCIGGGWVAAIDPERGRVLVERTVPGFVRGHARLPDRLVLLLAPASIGPASLAVAGADARLRTAALPETLAGSRRVPGHDYRMEIRTPGLAVDPEARRAYVLGADEPVAEVDLRALRVTYHVVDRRRTLHVRTKDVRGPYRTAAWVGDGVLAFTGWNGRARGRFDPVGVHLIDTRSWQQRTLAPDAQRFEIGDGMLLVPIQTGLAVFGPDGTTRLHVPGRFTWAQAVNGRAYAWRRDDSVLVVDLATGAAVPGTPERPLTLLDG